MRERTGEEEEESDRVMKVRREEEEMRRGGGLYMALLSGLVKEVVVSLFPP